MSTTTSVTPAEPSAARPGAPTAWHTLGVEEALHEQGVDAAVGLSTAEVEARTKQYGPNAFASAKKESRTQAFLRQYQDPMQIVLLVAGVISLVILRQWGTGIVLLGLTLFNAAMGLNQEGKAEASVAALQKMLIVKTRVRRGGQVEQLPAEELVPGDIVLVEAGDRVPADGRLLKAATLEIDESALTGESLPVPKQVETVAGADTPLGDRVDMAYMNTNATRGTGEILVTATGMSTEVGHISGLLQATEVEKTPLTQQLDALTRQIIVIALVALAISVVIGAARGQSLELLFLTAVAFAIAAIPTGLPAVVTYLLATGTTTLAASHAIVKRLRSVETLGATSAINSDKTGTLTLNQMTAVEMALIGQRVTVSGEGYSTTGQLTHVGGLPEVDLEPYLLPMALASDAVARDGALVGDPTEGALVVLAAKGGVDAVETRKEFPRVAEVPFDATYKLMATFHRMHAEDGREVIRCFVKGAPDQLLARGANALTAEGKLEPVDSVRDRYQQYNAQLGAQGLRVMALARRDFDPATFDPSAPDLLPLVGDLTLLALVGIVDPARPEAKKAIAEARSAGIQVRMITGDHAVTAGAIASELGIPGRGHHRRRIRRYERRRSRQADRRDRSDRPRRTRAQGAAGGGAQAPGPCGGDDRRWRQRRAGAQAGRHRRRHGHHRHRCVEGGGGHDPDRRQLRHHRACRGARARPVRQPGQVHPLPDGPVVRLHPAVSGRRAVQRPGWDPVPALPDPVDQLHGRPVPGHRHRSGQAVVRVDGASAASVAGTAVAAATADRPGGPGTGHRHQLTGGDAVGLGDRTGRDGGAQHGAGHLLGGGHLPGPGDQRRSAIGVQLRHTGERQAAADEPVLAGGDHPGDGDRHPAADLRHGVAQREPVGDLPGRGVGHRLGDGDREGGPPAAGRERGGCRGPAIAAGSGLRTGLWCMTEVRYQSPTTGDPRSPGRAYGGSMPWQFWRDMQ